MNATKLFLRHAAVAAVLASATFATQTRADAGDEIGTASITGLGPAAGSFTVPFEVIGDGPFAANDVDLYRVEGQRGQLLTAITSYPGTGLLADTILRVFDSSGKQLTFNDDTNGLYSRVDVVIPQTGSYYVGVSGFRNFFYDPNAGGSGADGNFSGGAYQLDLRLEGDVEASPGAKPTQFLRGHGFWNQTTGVPFGGNFINQVSIIAWTDSSGVAHGSATWVGGGDHLVPGKGGRTITGYPWHLEVTNFVRLNANTVFVEGIVTQSGQNPSDVGNVVQWTVRDNGSGASGEPDTVNDIPLEGGNFNVGP
jgi:hypothetical protein